MATIEEIEKRRADRKAKESSDRDAQIAKDLEAIDALEEARGQSLHAMTANGFKPGVCVKAAFRAPSPVEYKRYCDMVNKALGKGDQAARMKAQEMLGEVCWEYPARDSDERKAMLEAFPGVLISLAMGAAKVAELEAEEAGKG